MAATNSQRVIFYMPSFDDLTSIQTAAQDGYVTHVLIGMFHLGYNDATNQTNPYIHLNDNVPSDPSYDSLWSIVPTLQGYGAKVLGSLGGGGVGDYGNLFASQQSYNTFYALLQSTLQQYNLDGLDLDIEESGITTANVQELVGDLRASFKSRSGGFLVTSAPVASALTGGGSMSSMVDYNKLLSQFDWYNLQFYNGWGNLENGSSSQPPNFNPNYEGVVNACGSQNAQQLVAGVLTNPVAGWPSQTQPPYTNGYIALATLAPIITTLAQTYSNFGGVDGWTYQNALDEQPQVDPLGWAQTISSAMSSNS